MINAARAIMNDGATLVDVSGEVTIMILMTLCFLGAGSLLFKWE